MVNFIGNEVNFLLLIINAFYGGQLRTRRFRFLSTVRNVYAYQRGRFLPIRQDLASSQDDLQETLIYKVNALPMIPI